MEKTDEDIQAEGGGDMTITVDAPDDLQIMFIGYVARDYNGCLFASQHCATFEEIHGKTITLKKTYDEENAV